VNAVGGSLPDLRYATHTVHQQFESIVREGVRAELGMPSFKDVLTVDQMKAIQAYILNRAAESADSPNQ